MDIETALAVITLLLALLVLGVGAVLRRLARGLQHRVNAAWAQTQADHQDREV